ncbi:MAG TPA: hypothetical protein PLB49_08540 [Chitinophagaceae bacterium]|nr:hypothetical protein [Chitinophagaceae bacterium]
MHTLIRLFPALLLIIYGLSISQTFTSCKRPADKPNDTIVPPPPPPLPPDTVTLIRRLEETYYQGNPGFTTRFRDYSFNYDAQKRLVSVGLKNHISFITDSLTTRLFYTGNERYPRMIIKAYIYSQQPGPAMYDTTWITLDNQQRPIKDSSTDWSWNTTTNVTEHVFPLVRHYSYNGQQAKIDWLARLGNGSTIDLIRKDSIWMSSDSLLQQSKTQYFNGTIYPGNYTKAEAFISSQYLNPLALLNISGGLFSPIISPVRDEILGSNFHQSVYNSNPLPYYIDFCNRKLPASFFLVGYNNNGYGMGSGGIYVSTLITPWSVRPSYPSEMKVSMSYSYPDDKVFYKYFY